MTTQIIEPDMISLLGIDTLPEEEKLVMVNRVGGLIIESALTRLMGELSEEQVASLEHYLETDPEPDVLLDHLLAHHDTFKIFLDEETASFKEEATRIMSY